jgi:hypothetical protein
MFVDPCITVQLIKKYPTRCNNVSKFYYSMFIWSSTCFGRHTAHHQEPKTALAASGTSYVKGCWTRSWWVLSGTWQRPPTTRPTTFHVWKTIGCQCSDGFFIMNCTMMHWSMNIKLYILIYVTYLPIALPHTTVFFQLRVPEFAVYYVHTPCMSPCILLCALHRHTVYWPIQDECQNALGHLLTNAMKYQLHA